LELDDPANLRRTVYARISRLKLNDVLMQFDYPDANVHAEWRSVTSTPMQKLFVLNGPFVLAQAKALAARTAQDAALDLHGRPIPGVQEVHEELTDYLDGLMSSASKKMRKINAAAAAAGRG